MTGGMAGAAPSGISTSRSRAATGRRRLTAFDPGFELLSWRQAVVLETARRGRDASASADGTTASLPLGEMTWARRVAADGAA